jgi:DNA-binding response OmpR family regulator
MVREAILGENLPVQVNVMPDGERLIDYLTKAGMDPDVPLPNIIMLDLNLPKIHGLDVLRRIRAWDNYKDIPVLIITSSDAATDRGEALRLGAGYFRKPPNYEQFLKLGGMLKQFLAEKGML